MRNRLLFLLLCLSFSISVLGQKKLPKFGEIPMEDMKMTTYAPDSSASAIMLFNVGEVNMDEEGNSTVKRHVRIKILNKAGFDWADQSLRISHIGESISKLKGSTYNLEGGNIVESKMAETSIFKSKFNKYRDQIKFTLPNVKEGSIIEFSYVKRSGADLEWQFQYPIPVLWSEYSCWTPKAATFKKNMQGFLALTQHDSKDDGAFEHFVMADVPAFKVEPFVTNPDNYISSISFYLTEYFVPGGAVKYYNQSWGSELKKYNEAQEFGGLIRGSGFLKSTVDSLTAGVTDPQKKLQAIYDYVKSHVAWNEETDRIPDHNFKKVLEMKKGSSSEINLMMVSMLRKAGIAADPVFVSTRDNGMVRPFVYVIDQFNDVICVAKIGEKDVLVDATDRDLPMSALPERCLNGSGLRFSETEASWIEIKGSRSKKIINTDLKIDESGELTGQLSINYDGLAGGDMRKSYKDLGEEKYIKSVFEGRTWDVSKSEFKNLTDPLSSAREQHQVVIRDHAQANGPVIYLNPFVIDRLEENPFKSEKREYPVDFSSPLEKLYMGKITIPDGYVVEELPKPKVIVLPANGGKYAYNVVVTGNTISITSQFVRNKSMFVQDEYPFLREFYSQVVAKQAEQIVLKKK